MAYLKIGNLEIRAQKIEIGREPIWSKNAGRVATGKMQGDIIAQKYTLSIVLNPLNDKEAVSFDAAILPTFFYVTFKNPSTGKMETKRMYANGPKYPVYSYVDILPRYVGVGIELVEQ